MAYVYDAANPEQGREADKKANKLSMRPDSLRNLEGDKQRNVKEKFKMQMTLN